MTRSRTSPPRLPAAWWVCGAVACAIEETPPIVQDPPMTEVAIRVGAGDDAADITLAGAWVDETGDGHGVGASATLPGPPPLTVTGERSSWRLRDGVVLFEGSVQAVRGEVTLSCDQLEVLYAGERVEQARAAGDVRVVRGGRVARGATAVLTTATGEVVLEGAPTLEEGPNRMSGERIVLWLDDERLECVRCRLEVEGQAVAPVNP
jgi:lipopolysaccharide export system protein LptA